MTAYVLKRLGLAAVLMFLISTIVFILIQLPPGDFVSSRVERMVMEGTPMTDAEIANMRRLYYLDLPIYRQYLRWMGDILLRGFLGRSMLYDMPVNDVIGERVLTTVVLSVLTIGFTWAIAFPIGVVAAVRQYSAFDYVFSFIGFVGVSIPNFLFALVAIYTIFDRTGVVLSGLFSPELVDAPMSWTKLGDLLKRIWLPVLIVGSNGTAVLIRVVRGQMLDELDKLYVTAARAKGLPWKKVLARYPVRVTLNPMVSTIGWTLPSIFSGEAIVAVVLSLQTLGPVFLRALQNQDMYLAGSILLIVSGLSLLGTLISDILLAALDPRIRMGRGTADQT